MSKTRLQYIEPVKSSLTVEARQIEYLDKPVRFSFRYCSTKKDYCISTVSNFKDTLQTLYNRMGHLEDMTWQQAQSIDHAKGISIEGKKTENHKLLSNEFSRFDTYGHLRVNDKSKSKFRVFGAIQGDCFCILLFDVDGKINH